jgi:hypothetical protein
MSARARPAHAYVSYPYIEWYADNGRVVLELDSVQVEVVWGQELQAGTAADLPDAEKKRARAFTDFLTGLAEELWG